MDYDFTTINNFLNQLNSDELMLYRQRRRRREIDIENAERDLNQAQEAAENDNSQSALDRVFSCRVALDKANEALEDFELDNLRLQEMLGDYDRIKELINRYYDILDEKVAYPIREDRANKVLEEIKRLYEKLSGRRLENEEDRDSEINPYDELEGDEKDRDALASKMSVEDMKLLLIYIKYGLELDDKIQEIADKYGITDLNILLLVAKLKKQQLDAKEKDDNDVVKDNSEKEEPDDIEKQPVTKVPVEPEPKKPVPVNYDEDDIIKKYNVDENKLPVTIESIMNKLADGLNIQAKDKTASQVMESKKMKLREAISENMHTGNIKYNVANTKKNFALFFGKVICKVKSIFVKQEQRDRINALEERLDNLSDEEYEVILRDGTAKFFLEKKYPYAFTHSIDKKVTAYCSRKVMELNEINKKIYETICNAYFTVVSIVEKIRSGECTPEEVAGLENQKAEALSGKAELLKQYRENMIKASNYIQGGGKGITDIINGTTIGKGMNYIGYKDAVEHDIDEGLMAKEDELSRVLKYAEENGVDELAIDAFIQLENISLENTETKKRWFGEVSSGKREYNPAAVILDFRNDTYWRDMIGTVALGASAAAVVNGIVTHLIHNPNIVAEANAKIAQVENEIHAIGKDIMDKNDKMAEGMRSHSYGEQAGMQDMYERADHIHDGRIWQEDAKYWELDAQHHELVAQQIKEMNKEFANAANDHKNGVLSDADYLAQIADISNRTHDRTLSLYQEVIDNLKSYAGNNPQYDLTSTIEGIDYVLSHPDAVTQMNGGILEVMKDGEILYGIEIDKVPELDSDLLTTAIAAGSTLAYVTVVDSENKKKLNKLKQRHEEANEYAEMLNGEHLEDNDRLR